MIAAVSMGMSVDSSIHYLFTYRRMRESGLPFLASLIEAQQSAGRALMFSTLALVVGFSALLTSSFIPTIYFGALAMLTMIGSLVGNLVVLPLLLGLVERNGTSKYEAPKEGSQQLSELPSAGCTPT